MDADREMRCYECGARLFTSRAPALVEQAMPCPECGGALELVPASPSDRGFEQLAVLPTAPPAR
jgi:uncharacterized protein with PIN domain